MFWAVAMMFILLLFIVDTDFPISCEILHQQYPVVTYANNLFYTFWYDMKYYPPDRAIFGARITGEGMVIDPLGKLILRDRAIRVDAAFDGNNFLVVMQDSC
jgi:hypothetical protein